MEQVLGQHVDLLDLGKDIKHIFADLVSAAPEKYYYEKGNQFSVIGPNGSPITYGTNGKCPWFLIRGIKDERKQLNMLLIGKSLWGLEIGVGQKIKKSIEKYGKEKMIEYLTHQVHSLLYEPEKWREIHGYSV